MRIALLLYGQPRFFQYTYKYILQEYTIKDCETHIFAHFWKDIGFGPEDDKSHTYYNIENLEELLNNINAKKYLIEDYTDLDQALLYIEKQINKKYKRYNLGQHISMEKCFSLIQQYQKENNVKYDIVIKARTDILPIQNKSSYNTNLEYEDIKYNNYIAPFKTFLPGTKNIVVPDFQAFQIPEELLDNEYYYKKQQEKQNPNFPPGAFDHVLQILSKIKKEHIYKHKRVYIAIGTDIYNVADFKSAEIIYNNWLQKYIDIYKEYYNTDIYKHFLKRIHAVFNFFLLRENVNMHGTLCRKRYQRLVYSKSCKKKFIRNPRKGAIIIDDFNQLNDEYIHSKINK